MSTLPEVDELVEYRLTGGDARRIADQQARHPIPANGHPSYAAGDWLQLHVISTRPHSRRDEQLVIGEICVGAATFHQVEAPEGEAFGCWRRP